MSIYIYIYSFWIHIDVARRSNRHESQKDIVLQRLHQWRGRGLVVLLSFVSMQVFQWTTTRLIVGENINEGWTRESEGLTASYVSHVTFPPTPPVTTTLRSMTCVPSCFFTLYSLHQFHNIFICRNPQEEGKRGNMKSLWILHILKIHKEKGSIKSKFIHFFIYS